MSTADTDILRHEIMRLIDVRSMDDDWELTAIYLYITLGREPTVYEIEGELAKRIEDTYG